MNKQGFEVAYRHGKTGGWYLAGRPLNLSELQTVIDAVAATAGFQRRCGRLCWTSWPGSFPGDSAASCAARSRCRPRGDSARGGPAGAGPRPHRPCKASGHCVLSRLCTTRRGDGFFSEYTLVVSPKGLLWSEEGYHLLGWNHRSKSLAPIARIGCLRCWSRECPRRAQSRPGTVDRSPFGIEPNRRERVRLRCCRALADEILFDRLGSAVQLTAEGFFIATADVNLGSRVLGLAVYAYGIPSRSLPRLGGQSPDNPLPPPTLETPLFPPAYSGTPFDAVFPLMSFLPDIPSTPLRGCRGFLLCVGRGKQLWNAVENLWEIARQSVVR